MRQLQFLINPASGGRQGSSILSQLGRLYPAAAIGLLPGSDPTAWAQRAQASGSVLIACGGDGTAASVLEGSWQAHQRAPGAGQVAVGLIPLGTGNDLARSLGCQPSQARSLRDRLESLTHASVQPLDRWMVTGPTWQHSFYNYWSVGVDARIVRHFHKARTRHPRIFGSAFVNRLCYGVLGLVQRAEHLGDWVKLVGPGTLPIPPEASSLVFTNIPSYAGGARLSPAIRADDGQSEVFALGHRVLLGLATSGLRHPRRLGSVVHATLHLGRAGIMQVDGEPLLAPPGTYELSHAGAVYVLTHAV